MFVKFYYRTAHRLRRLRVALLRSKRVEVAVPIFPDEFKESGKPIFVIAPHRSGSSLLRRILNSHPNIYCPPESHFLEKFFEIAGQPPYQEGLRGIIGYDDSRLERFVGDWASHPFRVGMAVAKKKRWADKTPQYVFHLDFLERCFGPDCVYICLFRDPLDSATSIYLRGWRFGQYDADLLKNAACYVKDAQARMREFQKKMPQRVIAIDYQELVTDPSLSLKKLFAFLEEPWSEDVLRFFEKPHGLGIEDPIVTGTKGFYPSSDRWRELTAEQQATLRLLLANDSNAESLTLESASRG